LVRLTLVVQMNVPAGSVIVSPSCAFVSWIACTLAAEPSECQTAAPECEAKATPKNRAAKSVVSGLCIVHHRYPPDLPRSLYQDKLLGQARFSSLGNLFCDLGVQKLRIPPSKFKNICQVRIIRRGLITLPNSSSRYGHVRHRVPRILDRTAPTRQVRGSLLTNGSLR
jgi:hypothetical protein